MGMGNIVKWLGGSRGRRIFRMGGKSDEGVMNDGSSEFTIDELREFLDADHRGSGADPEFKEKLRKKLWDLVQARARERSGDDESQ